MEQNSNCSQCGGAIHFNKNDLAAVCGYCGVTTFRAKFAWELTNATKNIDTNAGFSLLEAKAAADDAISRITYVPISIFFSLLLVIIFWRLFF